MVLDGEISDADLERAREQIERHLRVDIANRLIGYPITSPDGNIDNYLLPLQLLENARGRISPDGKTLEVNGIAFPVVGTYNAGKSKRNRGLFIQLLL